MAGSCSHQCWEAETGRSPNSQLSQVCRICEPQVQWQMVSENKTENDRGWYSMLTWFQTHVDTCAHTWTCTHIHSQRHINIKILCLLITNCCCLIFNFFLIDWDPPPPTYTAYTHTCTQIPMHVWETEENIWGSGFSFHLVDFRDRSQVAGLSDTNFLFSHWAFPAAPFSSYFYFIKKVSFPLAWARGSQCSDCYLLCRNFFTRPSPPPVLLCPIFTRVGFSLRTSGLQANALPGLHLSLVCLPFRRAVTFSSNILTKICILSFLKAIYCTLKKKKEFFLYQSLIFCSVTIFFRKYHLLEVAAGSPPPHFPLSFFCSPSLN